MPDDERREIFARLGQLENDMGVIKANIGTVMVSSEKCATNIENLTEGLMGTVNRPGIVVRLDRLEQAESRRKKVLGAIVIAVAGILTKVVWDLITA